MKKIKVRYWDTDNPEPRGEGKIHGKHFWEVEVYARNDDLKTINAVKEFKETIITKEKCRFDRLKEIITEKIDEVLDDMPVYTIAGCVVYRIKQ